MTKMQNTKLCTSQMRVFSLQILCHQKLVSIKLANDNSTFTLTYVCPDCYLRSLYKQTLVRLPRPASGSPFHCWQSSIFGCWPSGVELPATGGYVGAVSDNLLRWTQDVPVHGIIS